MKCDECCREGKSWYSVEVYKYLCNIHGQGNKATPGIENEINKKRFS